ncbi:hypothetical protein L1049_014211 [Liquidambar formosana]|uniref:Uncharacterized protein n=1 Tax=Liquidambar formosana TaxID=63359 RepID=A0AAP0RQK1_LIQFO
MFGVVTEIDLNAARFFLRLPNVPILARSQLPPSTELPIHNFMKIAARSVSRRPPTPAEVTLPLTPSLLYTQ